MANSTVEGGPQPVEVPVVPRQWAPLDSNLYMAKASPQPSLPPMLMITDRGVVRGFEVVAWPQGLAYLMDKWLSLPLLRTVIKANNREVFHELRAVLCQGWPALAFGLGLAPLGTSPCQPTPNLKGSFNSESNTYFDVDSLNSLAWDNIT